MLKCLTPFALLLMVSVGHAQTYAEGYAIGTVKMKNNWKGEMALGNGLAPETSLKRITVGRGIQKTVSVSTGRLPFAIATTDVDTVQDVQTLSNNQTQMIVHFSQPFFGDFRYGDATLVDQAIPANSQLRTDICHSKSMLPGRSNGSTTGHIVKLSLEGYVSPLFTKVWEATVQGGKDGNQLANLTISDESMMQCLLLYLDANRPVKISYKEVKHPTSLQLVFDVVTVEPLSISSPTEKVQASGPVDWR